ncbi:hypothetical protein ESCO_002202 [Escovopsis weberi]|uniref:Kinetochore protein fta7 n=1 Tax=Escovopsis weberi TaxID=150374 RepID=A0A0M9VWJ7_ESCWE|nr:hypothetical protein ESCO_002202 [Escovopsis weberi]
MSSNTKPTVPQAPDLPRDAGAKRKRGRLPNAQRRDALDAPQPIAAAEEYDADADDAGRPRKRGRPLRSVNGGGAAEDGAPAKGAGRTSPRGKENRPLDDKAVAVPASAQDAKRKRGRPALGSHSSIEKPTQEQSKSKGRRSGKGATTNPTEKAADDKANNDDDGDGGGGEPAFPEKPYTHIAPHIHRVRQSEIKAKWTPLGESSIASVSSILRLAHRPILQRLSNTQQRREHTAAALRLVANRITHKIARGLPFPPPAMAGRAPPGGATRAADDDGGRAAELDFEGVLDAKQALERQLDPALHAVDLLRREKEKLKRELEKDYEVLRSLDLSARAQARDYRGLVRRAHVLAPAPETAARQNGDHEKDGVVPQRQASSGGLFDSLQDDEEDVKDIGLQLGSHAESIRNNLRQTEGILPQVSRSRAALQDVLFRYLDQEQYEHVLFG